MNIAIIGGGWVGCHLAYKLKKKHNIVLYEKNEKIFQETSSKNQNRLHVGYHYARNSKTRNLCRNTFDRFISEYGFCVNDIKKNFYCVPNHYSLLDFDTYKKIFNEYQFTPTEHNFINTEGCILTNEKHIDFKKVYNFFEEEIGNLVILEEIDNKKIKKLSNKFDLVIDATNNFLGKTIENFFYELTITLIYKKIKNTDFDSLTFVDGNLFSIYPYTEDKFTLTDVDLTPIKKFKKINILKNFIKKIDKKFLETRIKLIESKVDLFIPNFKDYFEYESYFLSTKSKIFDKSENRYPIIKKEGNIVSCFREC